MDAFKELMRPTSVRTVKNFKFDEELNSLLDRTLIRQNVHIQFEDEAISSSKVVLPI